MVAGEARDGGDGPDVNGDGVLLVLGDEGVEDEMRQVGESSVARRRREARPGAPIISRRS